MPTGNRGKLASGIPKSQPAVPKITERFHTASGQSRHSALARRRAAMQRFLAAQPKGHLAAAFSVGEHIIPAQSGTNLLGKADAQERLT